MSSCSLNNLRNNNIITYNVGHRILKILFSFNKFDLCVLAINIGKLQNL